MGGKATAEAAVFAGTAGGSAHLGRRPGGLGCGSATPALLKSSFDALLNAASYENP